MDRRRFLIGTAALLAGAALLRPPALAAVTATSPADDDEAARRHTAARKFLELPQGRIAYIDQGRGPAALFLHGFPLSSFQWRGAIARLSAHRRCLAPDWMGLGFTEPAPGQGVAPSDNAEMLAAFLDRLGVGEVDIIANDSGGAVAQLFMTRYRGRVKSLVLTNCDVETDSPPPAVLPIIDLARSGLYPELYLEPWVNRKDEARAPTGLGGMCFTNPANPTDAALEQYLRPLVATAERKTLVNRYTLGLAPNPLAGVEAKLRDCRQPIRIVWGMGDTIFAPTGPDYLAGIMPQATIRRLPAAKLFWPEEYPEVIAEEARLLWEA